MLTTASKQTLTAMADLRAGRISADDYRAIMREQRSNTTEQSHNANLLAAFAVDKARNER